MLNSKTIRSNSSGISIGSGECFSSVTGSFSLPEEQVYIFMCVLSLCVCVCEGLGQEASTSTVDLDLEPGAATECRDRGLGGTREVNTEECFMGTSMANQTGDSSCPLWLRKVCYGEGTEEYISVLSESESEIFGWRLTEPKLSKVLLLLPHPTGAGGRRVHPDA